ncbi:ComF family protein [Caproiciproducens faecalis]|uniref:ComF family protein n=1 Tax=Caproiciproducens faecalis TaxID=2820301 RepID=A0ABS7DQF6_9FIRM|nr:ComF family protein [Caproiciproducens faecalis]MBW7573443.1 ComF family protein [Caproiciproducens faecalis]
MSSKLFSVFLDLIFPPKCIFCREIALPGQSVCEKCSKEILHASAIKCIYLPNSGETILCFAPYPYTGKIRESIIRFKFYGHNEYTGFYAESLSAQIGKKFPQELFDSVTSVPISAERYQVRGYNQSELLGKAVAKCLGLPYREYLIKTHDNPEQHKLSEKDRRRNVRGVYRINEGEQAAGKRILLIDDIVTTGATLGECASVLLDAGAKKVICAAAAHAL